MGDTLIAGATDTVYTPIAEDVGFMLFCRETAHNAWLTGPDPSADTNVVGPIAAGAVAPPGPPTTNLYFWLTADAGTLQTSGGSAATANGDPVGEWQDQSGNGRHWAKVVGPAAPVLQLSVVNGHSVLRFADASNQWLDGPNLSALTGTTTGGEIFIVLNNAVSASGVDGAIWRIGTGSTPFYDFGGTIYEDFGLTTRQDGITPSGSTHVWRLYNCAVDVASGFDVYMDGTSIYHLGSVTTALISFHTAPRVGNNGGYSYAGDIAEVIFYSARCNSTDKAAVKSYIATKYGLTIA